MFLPDYARQLARAGCRAVIDLGLVPSTTLTTPAAVGDASVTVANTATIVPSQVLSWWDQPVTTEPEPSVVVGTPTGNALPLDFSGRPWTGLQQTHAAGGLVATNIVPWPLGDNAVAFDNGFPVIGVYVLDNTRKPVTSGQMQEFCMLTFCYQIRATQDVDNRLDSQLFLGNQLDRAELGMSQLITSLMGNFTIKVDGASNCQEITQFVESRRSNETNPKRPVFEFLLDCQVRGAIYSLRG